VIGGGAAGIFCAVNAARRGLAVIVLEKTGKLLSKVAVSGGGRCNVTHACFTIDEMVKKYPRGGRFVKKAFHRWFTTDTVGWFSERGVVLKTEEDGRMFPVSDSSQTIIDCLMQEANKWGVEIRTRADVVGVAQVGNAAGFRVQLADLRVLDADYVCIACGGYPKAGMFEWVERLGHSIEAPVPSLFTFNMPGNPITKLMGVTVGDVQVKIPGAGTRPGTGGGTGSGSRGGLVERGPLLITHWGMSGPVILRLSAWGARELAVEPGYHFTILINWVPDFSEHSLRKRMQELRFELASQKMLTRNPFGLPQRLWEFILAGSGIGEGMRWADLPGREQGRLIMGLCASEFAVRGKTTFKEEFVTAGGVRLAEVDPSTMQSRRVPGLFFAGEILDVDGVTGGFNFQHAWTSGWIAAESMIC
jgi:predicted Rossmann fold flavoprotein